MISYDLIEQYRTSAGQINDLLKVFQYRKGKRKHHKIAKICPNWVFAHCIIVFVMFCTKLGFRVISQFEVLSWVTIWFIFSFVTFRVFWFGHNWSVWFFSSHFEFKVLSEFKCLNVVTIWVFEFCYSLNFITIWFSKFCHNLSFWVWSQGKLPLFWPQITRVGAY